MAAALEGHLGEYSKAVWRSGEEEVPREGSGAQIKGLRVGNKAGSRSLLGG